MFVLAWVIMATYQAPFDLNARIANISVILLAYIAFIPTLRSISPPTPYFTLSDFVLNFNLIGCLITLLYSFLVFRFAVDKKDTASPDP